MISLDKNNYESYLLDYFEGTLSAEDSAEVEKFLSENPEITAEVSDFEIIPLISDESEVFENKESLKKNEVTPIFFIEKSEKKKIISFSKYLLPSIISIAAMFLIVFTLFFSKKTDLNIAQNVYSLQNNKIFIPVVEKKIEKVQNHFQKISVEKLKNVSHENSVAEKTQNQTKNTEIPVVAERKVEKIEFLASISAVSLENSLIFEEINFKKSETKNERQNYQDAMTIPEFLVHKISELKPSNAWSFTKSCVKKIADLTKSSLHFDYREDKNGKVNSYIFSSPFFGVEKSKN